MPIALLAAGKLASVFSIFLKYCVTLDGSLGDGTSSIGFRTSDSTFSLARSALNEAASSVNCSSDILAEGILVRSSSILALTSGEENVNAADSPPARPPVSSVRTVAGCCSCVVAGCCSCVVAGCCSCVVAGCCKATPDISFIVSSISIKASSFKRGSLSSSIRADSGSSLRSLVFASCARREICSGSNGADSPLVRFSDEPVVSVLTTIELPTGPLTPLAVGPAETLEISLLAPVGLLSMAVALCRFAFLISLSRLVRPFCSFKVLALSSLVSACLPKSLAVLTNSLKELGSVTVLKKSLSVEKVSASIPALSNIASVTTKLSGVTLLISACLFCSFLASVFAAFFKAVSFSSSVLNFLRSFLITLSSFLS